MSSHADLIKALKFRHFYSKKRVEKIYKKKTWVSVNKRYIVTEVYHSWRALPHNPKIKEQRLPKEKESDVSQEERNRRRKRDKITRLLLDNFKEGDMYLTCTFKKGPPSVEYIRKEWEKLKRKLRTVFQRAGKEFRYVSIIENETGGGRPHGHIIIPQLEGLTMAQIRRMWGLGFVKAAEYGGAASDARNLAAYFTKSKTARYNSGIQNSKNLTQNEPKETLVKRSETFYGKIRPPKGYIPIEVDGWTASGFTEEGFPYIRTVFELYEPPRKRRRNVLPKEERTYVGRGKEENQRGRYEKPIPGGA